MNDSKLLWKPFDKKFIDNPYVMYKRLREEDPVHLSQTGEYIITGYEHAKYILRSNDFVVGNRLEWLKKGIGYFHFKNYDFSAIEQALKGFILFLNAPDHTRIRKFIHDAWDSRDVERIIRKNISVILENCSRETDLISSLAKPLPSMTISGILGLPEKDYTYLREQGTAMIKALDLYISFKDIKQINEAAKNFVIYFQQVIERKEKNPDEFLISKLIALNKEARALSEDELLSSCILLFLAGEETSLSLMSTGLFNLLRHPELITNIQRDPSKIPDLVEELIRFDAPVQIVGRITSQQTTIADKTIPKGSALTICLGAANRDPQVFEQPDEMMPDRSPNRHLGFGGGAHYCLGDWLARMQTSITIGELLDRHKNIQLLNPQPEWNQNLAIRTLKKLPVKLY